MTDEWNEVCPTCGCYEHCRVQEGPTTDGQGIGRRRYCEHCGDGTHEDDGARPRCKWSEANLAEQHSSDVHDAMTFYPHLPSSREAREELADCGFLDDDHEWTDLGERVGQAIRGRQAERISSPA
jgi:hypothetical protein